MIVGIRWATARLVKGVCRGQRWIITVFSRILHLFCVTNKK